MNHELLAIKLAVVGWGMSCTWVIAPDAGKVSQNKGERKRNKSTRWC